MKEIAGGVTAAKGFQAASAAAEIKYKNRTDMAMIYSQVPCLAAGTFTTNVVKAAPVKWDQEIVYQHPGARAVVCNSGIANACTGSEGYGYCKETAQAAAETLGISESEVLVASTGVIGMQLPIEKNFRRGESHGAEAVRYAGSGDRGGKGDHDNRYRKEGNCRADRNRRKNSDRGRHVQGVRNDTSEHVHNAWICHHRCMHIERTAAVCAQ